LRYRLCRLSCTYRRFCANFSRLSNIPIPVKPKNEFFFWPLGGSEVQPHSEINLPGTHGLNCQPEKRAAQNIKEQPAKCQRR
jgi:hypothetical protein